MFFQVALAGQVTTPKACRSGFRFRPGILCAVRTLGSLLAGVGLMASVRLEAAIVINELHYAPDVKTEPVEFVELFNPEAQAVDVGGWQLAGGISFRFPAGRSIAPGGYAVVAADSAALRAKFGLSNADGPWMGKLSNQGDKIVLQDSALRVVDEVAYRLGFPWPTVGDAPGYSSSSSILASTTAWAGAGGLLSWAMRLSRAEPLSPSSLRGSTCRTRRSVGPSHRLARTWL